MKTVAITSLEKCTVLRMITYATLLTAQKQSMLKQNGLSGKPRQNYITEKEQLQTQYNKIDEYYLTAVDVYQSERTGVMHRCKHK